MIMSIFDNEILTNSLELICPLLSVNFSYVCFIYAEIFEKMLSGSLEVPFSIYLYLIELPISKINFTGHWLRYSTTPNVTNIFTESSQAIKVALILFAAILNWSLHFFLVQTTDKFSHPFIRHWT